MADIMSSAEKDHKGQFTLQSVIAAVLGNQLPCPHESCRNSQGRVKFYSENGIEQHWKTSHSGKRLDIKSIKAMGNTLLKSLHFSRLSSIYEEQFCKDEQLPLEKVKYQMSFGGIVKQFYCKNIDAAVKKFGILLHAGGFIPKFSSNSKGIILQVDCVDFTGYFTAWYDDCVNAGRKYTKIKYLAHYVESMGNLPQIHADEELLPALEKNNPGQLEITGDPLLDTLRNLYKLPSFRPFQREVIESTLSGNNTLAVLPTGYGKTLCFTLPAIILTGVTFAIFPLNSLMIDMFNHFNKLLIPCCMVNQYSTKDLIASLLHDLQSERPATKIILITPESLQRKEFQNVLSSLSNRKILSLIAIDEMHCIAESSFQFRGDYRKLDTLINHSAPILGLTATATSETLTEVQTVLKLNNPKIFKDPAWRPNLVIKIIQKKSKEKVLDEIQKLITEEHYDECGIIYCLHQSDVNEVAYRLSHSEPSSKVSIYYGQGLDQQSRNNALSNWLSGATDILTATRAAGTGIDKGNVRFVFQIGWSDSLEEYYQQIGRAGRDGLTSLCVMFPLAGNKSFHLKHLMQNQEEAFRQQGVKRANKMYQYIQHLRCRKQFICTYFGDPMPGECSLSCDNCMNSQRYRELNVKDDIRKLVQCLQAISVHIREPTTEILVKTFVGSKSKIVTDAKLHELNEHGIGHGYSAADTENILQVALNEDIVQEFVPYNKLGRGRLSYLLMGKHGFDVFCGRFQKDLYVDRK